MEKRSQKSKDLNKCFPYMLGRGSTSRRVRDSADRSIAS